MGRVCTLIGNVYNRIRKGTEAQRIRIAGGQRDGLHSLADAYLVGDATRTTLLIRVSCNVLSTGF